MFLDCRFDLKPEENSDHAQERRGEELVGKIGYFDV